MSIRVVHGDCREVMRSLEPVSVDAVVTDPPYELAFMGRAWDKSGVTFEPATWAEVLRVLKPGGCLLAFGGTRRFHRMMMAIEDAGFEVRDTLMWITGQGFPKHRNALKPAWEPIVLARKPLVCTVAANILRWGTGAINVDACRVESGSPRPSIVSPPKNGLLSGAFREGSYQAGNTTLGRWPPNLLHDGSDEVVACFPDRRVNPPSKQKSERHSHNIYGKFVGGRTCHGFDTDGSASRFFPAFPLTEADRIFYHPKAGKADRAGSRHPTVKPIKLMRWLCRLVTPPGGLILDVFAGSGTTLQAAREEGFSAIGIEQSAEYVADIERRLAARA